MRTSRDASVLFFKVILQEINKGEVAYKWLIAYNVRLNASSATTYFLRLYNDHAALQEAESLAPNVEETRRASYDRLSAVTADPRTCCANKRFAIQTKLPMGFGAKAAHSIT